MVGWAVDYNHLDYDDGQQRTTEPLNRCFVELRVGSLPFAGQLHNCSDCHAECDQLLNAAVSCLGFSFLCLAVLLWQTTTAISTPLSAPFISCHAFHARVTTFHNTHRFGHTRLHPHDLLMFVRRLNSRKQCAVLVQTTLEFVRSHRRRTRAKQLCVALSQTEQNRL